MNILECSKAEILRSCSKCKPLLHCPGSLKRDNIELFDLYTEYEHKV